MAQKPNFILYCIIILFTGLFCSILAALLIELWIVDKKLPLGILAGVGLANAGLHFNLYLIGYRKVTFKRYLLTTLLFCAFIYLFVFGAFYLLYYLCFIAWGVMALTYLLNIGNDIQDKRYEV